MTFAKLYCLVFNETDNIKTCKLFLYLAITPF